MKKISLVVTVFLVVALLAMTYPAAVTAAGGPVGEKIRVRDASIEFAAGAPFYIQHGWIQTSEDGAIGIFDFQLKVDGFLVREDYKSFSAQSGDPDILTRLWGFSFPSGMSGTHTFTGHWFAPCGYAVDWLGYPGPCATPNEKVETSTRTLVVTFVP